MAECRPQPGCVRGEVVAQDLDLRDPRQLRAAAGRAGATPRPAAGIAADEASGDELGTSRGGFFDSGRWAGMWSTAVSRWDDLPEERVVSSELRTTLLETIDALPRMQRAVITLRDVEGWAPEEICDYLGLASSNQRVLLHRARTAARLAIERYLEEGAERC